MSSWSLSIVGTNDGTQDATVDATTVHPTVLVDEEAAQAAGVKAGIKAMLAKMFPGALFTVSAMGESFRNGGSVSLHIAATAPERVVADNTAIAQAEAAGIVPPPAT